MVLLTRQNYSISVNINNVKLVDAVVTLTRCAQVIRPDYIVYDIYQIFII